MSTKLRIGIAGLGNVGAGVIDLVQRQDRLRLAGAVEITGVSARNRSRERPVDISAYQWFDDPVELARSGDVDILVELVGGSDGPAKKSVEAALGLGKPVVTANKALVAEHGMELAEASEANNAPLLFEAAVAGAIPIVRVLSESLAGSRVTSIRGILNGTCNYLLSEMIDRKASYDEVLAEAKRLGYAEADPYLDVSGMDAAHKIAILSTIGFSAQLDFGQVVVNGVEGIELIDLLLAEKLGYTIKLIAEGCLTKTGVRCQVAPAALALDHPLARISGPTNAVLLDVDPAGQLTLTGAGAGSGPTASAVMGDISRLFKRELWPTFSVPRAQLENQFVAPGVDDETSVPYFVRVTLTDQAGALAAFTNGLAEDGVSVDTLIQNSAGETGEAPVAITTHPCTKLAATKALNRVAALDCVVGEPRLIHIETS